MSAYIPQTLRDAVRRRAHQRCEYCHSVEWLTGQRHELDHILPVHLSGGSTFENLCLACSSCNRHKQIRTTATDPESGAEVSLFNPRLQLWREHFTWNAGGMRLVGLTAIGRATIEALAMNHSLVVAARSFWVSTGQHPPSTDE